MTNKPRGFGQSSMRRVNGIDFSRSVSIPDITKPEKQRSVYRIGNTKVSRWLFELTLAMATQIEEGVRPEGEKT